MLTGPLRGETYEEWRGRHFTTGEMQDPGLEGTIWGTKADPDRDLVPNLVEYFQGGNPRLPEGTEGVRISSGSGNVGVSIKHRHSLTARSGDLKLQISSDLKNWREITVAEASRSEGIIDAETVDVEWRYTGSASGSYVRLMAELSPAGGPSPEGISGDVFYVDQNHVSASDANDGLSEEQPWESLDKAFGTVQAGDFVYVKGSTDPEAVASIYDRAGKDGFSIQTPGSPSAGIVFRNFPGHTVVVEGDGGDDGMALDQASYHHFYGFVIRNFAKATEGFAAKTDITIEGCEFTQTTETGLRLREVTNLVLRDVYVHHCFESGISIRTGNNVLLERVESSYNDDQRGRRW